MTLGPKKGPVTRMLFQEGGDALVMAGDFQAEFCHGVPARSTWKDLKSLPMFATMKGWEKVGLQQEIALHEGAAPEAKHVRMNCTLRWHSTHWAGCPVRGQEGHGTQLRTRKIENCKKELTTDLFKHGHVIGMYWENIARSMVERANRDAQDLDVPLFCLQAADQRHSRKNKAIDKQLTHQLLTVPNPHRTGKLQGMLLVHENMVVRLADVLAPHLGLVKDKLAVVVKVDLHHEDQKRLDRREPGFCHFFPDYMAKGIWVKLLKGKNSPMEDALLQTWEEKFQNVADHTTDAKTLFFVELVHAEFKIDLKLGEETEKIEVIRWQFPLLHGMLRTAYSAQGLTLDGGVLVDLRRGGGLEDADWWLAIYVMLTRARKLKNLILLGFTEQVEELLRRGPPTYLRELTDKLETKAASTLERLQSWPVYDALQAS